MKVRSDEMAVHDRVTLLVGVPAAVVDLVIDLEPTIVAVGLAVLMGLAGAAASSSLMLFDNDMECDSSRDWRDGVIE